MEIGEAMTVLSALSQSTRYRCVSHLVDHGRSTAGDLAVALGVPANTMSSHLTILSHAGLVKSTREGRNIFYEPVIEPLAALAAKLGHLTSRQGQDRPR